MRKFIIALVAMAALFTTGCTIQVDSKPSDSPSASESAKSLPSVTPDEADEIFLTTVRKEYPFLKDVPDSDLIGLAKDACAMMDNGATVSDLFTVFGNSGNDKVDSAMAFMIGSGTVAYCPEHIDRISTGSPT